MRRWTASFPLNFDVENVKDISSTQIGTQIWMMLEHCKKDELMDFHVFDTANGSLTKVKCQNDDTRIVRVQTIGYDNGFIYAWVDECVTEDVEYKQALHKLDLATLIWKKINVECPVDWPQFTISNNHMYVPRLPVKIFDIDLVEETVTMRTVDVRESNGRKIISGRHLAFYNNQLYHFDHLSEELNVSLIDNNFSTRELSQNSLYNDELPSEYGSPGRFLVRPRNSTTENWQYDAFDFENGTWCRYEVENYRKYSKNTRMLSHCEIDGKVYAIVKFNKQSKYEIRVLDLDPSLSSVCLHNLVDSVIDLDPSFQSIKAEEIRGKLPNPMQKEFDARFNWKASKKSVVPRVRRTKKRNGSAPEIDNNEKNVEVPTAPEKRAHLENGEGSSKSTESTNCDDN